MTFQGRPQAADYYNLKILVVVASLAVASSCTQAGIRLGVCRLSSSRYWVTCCIRLGVASRWLNTALILLTSSKQLQYERFLCKRPWNTCAGVKKIGVAHHGHHCRAVAPAPRTFLSSTVQVHPGREERVTMGESPIVLTVLITSQVGVSSLT
jgi:hypothetical protein